jgi:hypothetical protein
MLVKEAISFERGKDPKELLGIGPDALIKKFKDSVKHGNHQDHFNGISNDYEEKDNAMYFILYHKRIKDVSDYRINTFMDIFENNPHFEFDDLKEVNPLTLDLKNHNKYIKLNTTRVIVKFKFR